MAAKSTTAPAENPLKKVIDLLLKGKAEVNQLLKDAEHGMTLLGFNADIDRIVNRLAFLSGHEVQSATTEEFPPVTNFMGEEIKVVKDLKPEDLQPGQEERQQFVNKVEKLYAEFDTLHPEAILNNYTLEEDKLIIRGVAKRAGIEDYEDRAINLSFIEEIAKAIKDKAAGNEQQERIDEELRKGGSGKTDKKPAEGSK